MSEIIEPSCEEIEKPLFPQLIVVDKVERNTKGSLSNKKHCCAFCEKLYPNIARHLSLKHKNEIAVGKILALPKQSKERRKMWDELVKKGDFAYNYDILTTGKGTLIPKYRARDAETTIKNVLPCQYCRGMYRRKELWRHQKSCKSRVASPGYETGPIAGGKKLLPVTCSDKAFHDNIILNIKEDEVKLAILSDQTILDFGLNLYNDQGHQQHKHVYISQKMRELGRLNIAGKKNNLMSIEECMKKENWDLLILSVKEVSEFNPETKNFGIPSLALKLGHSLKTCADDIYFKALKVGDTVKQEVANTFLEIYKLRWNKEISGKALTTLDTIKYNRPKLLPLVEDVAKLNNYIKEKCEHVSSESQSSDVYREFCQLCLAQIIVFNRKRSGEAERMTVSQFKKAKVGGIIDPVIMSTLTEFEQTLCKSYLRVEIVGKKGRKVPVLLTNAMQKNLNMLVTLRSQLNIRDDFMFARPGNTRFPFRGVDCLRNIVNQAGLKFPEIITSTSLRKQLATMAQVLNLNDTSQDLLAAFEGHDIRIHRQFYRLPEETMQVAKVSRLLHCLNNGTIGKYSGCNFDDIEFEIDGECNAYTILKMILPKRYTLLLGAYAG